MRRQLRRVASWPRATTAFVLLLLTAAAPTRVHAQALAITSGVDYGTRSIGEVELPLSASGGTGNYSWSVLVGSLPPGLAIRHDVPSWFPPGTATGLIGLVTTPGTYNFTVQVSDGVTAAQQPVTVRISTLRATSPYQLPDAFKNAGYSVQLAAAGAAGALTWTTVSTLPPGLSLASDGTLSGTPTTHGSWTMTGFVTDGTSTVPWNASITVSAVQITTDGVLPHATAGQPFSTTIVGAGCSGSCTLTLGGGLPDGLSFSTGTISGTPTQSGRWAFPVTVTDAALNSYTKNMSLTVVAVPAQLPQVQPYGTGLDDCAVGIQCQRGLNNWSPVPTPISWQATGLPAGMAIRWGSGVASQWMQAGDAELWGSPAVAGNYTVAVTATDATRASATHTFPLHVSAIWASSNPPGGTMGTPYSYAFTVLGGSGSYTGALTGGALPAGLTFSSTHLTISGTPAEGGSFSPQFTFDDGQGNSFTTTLYFYIANAGNTSSSLSIYDTDLGDARVNTFYQRALSACCRPSVVWAVENGPLPAGLSLSSDGVLSGTPTATGQYAFVVRAADGTNASDYTLRRLTLNVTSVFPSTNPALPFGNVSVPYSQQLQASGGTGPYTWTVVAGSFLPPGLSLTSNGLLAGTPSASGQFGFSIRVFDTVTSQQSVTYFTLAIYPYGTHPPLLITSGQDFGVWSIGIVQASLIARDGTGTYSWSVVAGALPPGLVIRPDGPGWFPADASAGIIGIATTPGTYNFTLRVNDGVETRDQAATIRIVPLTIKELWALPDAFAGTAYSYTLTPLGNVGAVTWGTPNCGNPSCSLPPGLTLNTTTGEISGTPTTPGFYNPQISYTADGTTIATTLNIGVYAINVGTSPEFALPGGVRDELPNAAQSQAYSATFAASGGAPPYTFSSNSLPNGLSLDASAGVLSGTYNGVGHFQFTITATDSHAASYSRQFVVHGVTSPAALPSIAVSGGRFGDCSIGVTCTRTVYVSNGAKPPFTWSASGLPAGLSFRQGSTASNNERTPAGDASIWGVPTVLGDFNVTLTVTDANGGTASTIVPLHVSELFLDAYLPSGTYGTGYNGNLRILGGTASYSTQVVSPSPSNRLPAGLSLNSAANSVTGTPIETGFFGPDLQITDTAAPTPHRLRLFNYFSIADQGIGTIQINTGSDLGYVAVGSQPLIAFSACCVPSMSWSVAGGSLPTGTSLSPAGQLFGTYSAPGTFTFLLRAQNSNDPTNFAARQFTLTVTPLGTSTSFTLPFGNVGSAYSQTLQTTCATGYACTGVTFALGQYELLPPGLSLSTGGLLSGTPTVTGEFTFLVNVADAGGHLFRTSFRVSIYPPGSAPPLATTVGSSFGPFAVGQVTITFSTSNTAGGVPPYHYALAPGATVIAGMRVQDGPPLPTSFSAAQTAAYIGVLTTPGSYSTTIRISDSAPTPHTLDQPIAFVVTPLSVLTLSPLPKATAGAPYSFTLAAAGGSGSYSWIVPPGSSLPSGLTISPSGEISGTPDSSGQSTFNVKVTDTVSGETLTWTLSLTVNAFAITTNGALPIGRNGQPYSQQLSAPGCTACAWSVASSLPGGSNLTLSSTGLLSTSATTLGTSGTFTFTVRATGSNGTVDKVFSLIALSNLSQAVVVTTPPALSALTVGNSASQLLSATGGTPPYSWSVVAGALPPGTSIVNSGGSAGANLGPGVGYVVGRPTQVGSFGFTLRVTDATAATADQTFSWNISALNLQYGSLPVSNGPSLTRGVSYTQPLLAIGGTSHYTWTATMPAGLTLNPSTGVVGGTPLDSGSFTVPVMVVDDGGNAITTNLNVNIATGTGPTLGASATQGPFGLGSSVSVSLSPSGGGGAPFTVTALSALPPGFALLADNAVLANGTPGSSYFLAGTPLASGVFTFTLQVQDKNGATGQRTFTLTVSPASVLAIGALVDASVGAPYSRSSPRSRRPAYPPGAFRQARAFRTGCHCRRPG